MPGTSWRCKLDYFVSLDNPPVFVVKSFTDHDGNNNCCLTTSGLIHHAAISFINFSGILCHCGVNQE